MIIIIMTIINIVYNIRLLCKDTHIVTAAACNYIEIASRRTSRCAARWTPRTSNSSAGGSIRGRSGRRPGTGDKSNYLFRSGTVATRQTSK